MRHANPARRVHRASPKAGAADHSHGHISKCAPDVNLLALGSRLAQAPQQTFSAAIHQRCIPLQALAEECRVPCIADAPVKFPAAQKRTLLVLFKDKQCLGGCPRCQCSLPLAASPYLPCSSELSTDRPGREGHFPWASTSL